VAKSKSLATSKINQSIDCRFITYTRMTICLQNLKNYSIKDFKRYTQKKQNYRKIKNSRIFFKIQIKYKNILFLA